MRLLVCGTQTKKDYRKNVFHELDWKLFASKYIPFEVSQVEWEKMTGKKWSFEIVEGCCKDSADQYAEEWAVKNNIKIYHFPATSGTYLKRNITMLENADEVLAFWDGWSYGTAHTIANAVMARMKVTVIKI